MTTPEHRCEQLALIACADQLVGEADASMRDAENVLDWCRAEDCREMLVEMRDWTEGHLDDS